MDKKEEDKCTFCEARVFYSDRQGAFFCLRGHPAKQAKVLKMEDFLSDNVHVLKPETDTNV